MRGRPNGSKNKGFTKYGNIYTKVGTDTSTCWQLLGATFPVSEV
jgi:hypothetical protein